MRRWNVVTGVKSGMVWLLYCSSVSEDKFCLPDLRFPACHHTTAASVEGGGCCVSLYVGPKGNDKQRAWWWPRQSWKSHGYTILVMTNNILVKDDHDYWCLGPAGAGGRPYWPTCSSSGESIRYEYCLLWEVLSTQGIQAHVLRIRS